MYVFPSKNQMLYKLNFTAIVKNIMSKSHKQELITKERVCVCVCVCVCACVCARVCARVRVLV